MTELHLMGFDLKTRKPIQIKSCQHFGKKFKAILNNSKHIVQAEFHEENNMLYITMADQRTQLAVLCNIQGLIYPMLTGLIFIEADKNIKGSRGMMDYQDVFGETQSDMKRKD